MSRTFIQQSCFIGYQIKKSMTKNETVEDLVRNLLRSKTNLSKESYHILMTMLQIKMNKPKKNRKMER